MFSTKTISAASAALLLTAASVAEAQDAAAGEAAFRQCQSCHVVEDPDGNVLAGRGKTGPNLYGIIGRQAGSVEGFRYRPAIVQAGEQGLVWDTDNIQAYLEDPTSFLRETLGDNSARSGMSYRLRRGQADMAAYLATFSE